MDPDAWQLVHVADYFWRVKPARPEALGLLTAIVESKGGLQVQAINEFLARHMHADDLQRMLERMTDPDDDFGQTEYQELYRATVTLGTARPFLLSSLSPARRLIAGGSFDPGSHWAALGRHSRR